MSSVPLFSIFCIDFRFDAFVADFYKGIGRELSYYASTVAGGAMPLGYKKYCKQVCNGCKNKSCNPSNSSMKLLKNNLVENLNIALTLSPITESFLLNHQDCGAIKGFLSCSGYPTVKGSNNKKEIDIVASLPRRYKIYSPSTFEEYQTIRDDIFWLKWPEIEVINDSVLDLYFSHHNVYDRKENHIFINKNCFCYGFVNYF